jgi:hypothetical protein
MKKKTPEIKIKNERLFEDDMSLNKLGSNVAYQLGAFLDGWIDDNKLEDVNPMELKWIISNEIDIRLEELYLDKSLRLQLQNLE